MTIDINKKENKIRALLNKLSELGAMRPGTLSVQYRNPKEKKTPFHQLSYTHKSKSHSEYVRTENLSAVKAEIENYKKFRLIVEEITELSLDASRLRHKRQ